MTILMLAFAVLLGSGSGSGLSHESSGPHLGAVSLQVFDDRLETVPGAVVQVWNGVDEPDVVVADAFAQTPWLDMEVPGWLELTLVERTLRRGVALGAIRAMDLPPVAGGGVASEYWISTTQPLAVPVLATGLPDQQNTIFAEDGSCTHWSLLLPADSSLRFATYVGVLMDEAAVEEYLAYRGHDPDASYVRGVVLVVPDLQAGSDGFAVSIALLGDLAPTDVVVDAFDFHGPGSASPPGEPPLSVELAGIQDDMAVVQVTGRIRKGQLALLIRSKIPGPAQVDYVLDEPPGITIPPGGGGGTARAEEATSTGIGHVAALAAAMEPVSVAGRVQDCEPPVPMPPDGWSCDPIPPDGGPCPVSPGPKECKTTRMRTAAICLSPGSKFEAMQALIQSFKVSFSFPSSGDGTSYKTGGGFEYGVESKTVLANEWTPEPGEFGLGQCMRYFRFYLVCAQRWNTKMGQLVWNHGENTLGLPTPCEILVPATTACTDLRVSQSVCSRTP